MNVFDELVASRKMWIENVLRPWCRTATRSELLKAEREWTDIAGRASPEFTLWPWAWSRFPAIYVEGLQGIDESFEVCVSLRDGHTVTGFPDNQLSQRGQLVVVNTAGSQGPYSLDLIVKITRA